MQPEAAVFVLLRFEIAQHFLLGDGVDAEAGDVTGGHVQRQQEQRAAVVAVPGAVGVLRAAELIQAQLDSPAWRWASRSCFDRV